jgi:hypothetical protein
LFIYMYLLLLDYQDIDHVSYVHQAFEAASLSYFLEILQSNLLNDFDVSYEIKILDTVLNFVCFLEIGTYFSIK